MMQLLLRCSLALAMLSLTNCPAQNDVLDQVKQLEPQGQFKKAAAVLTAEIKSTSLAAPQRKTLEFELDRLQRIRQDFPYTKEELFSELKKSVKDLTRKEYEQWIAEGRFDSREIDGKRYFMSSSVSNLYFRYPELNPRRIPLKDHRAHEKAVFDNCIAITQAAQAEQKPYVLPKRFHVDMNVTAKP